MPTERDPLTDAMAIYLSEGAKLICIFGICVLFMIVAIAAT